MNMWDTKYKQAKKKKYRKEKAKCERLLDIQKAFKKNRSRRRER